MYASIAATGAGLHVAALHIEHEAHIGPTAVMLSITIPVALYFVMLGRLYGNLVGVRLHGFTLTVVKLGGARAGGRVGVGRGLDR